MHALRTLLIGLAVAGSGTIEAGGPIPIPSDLSVSLSAEPSADLRPGDVVSFTISITNNGPEPVDRFALLSSPIYDELDVLNGTADCDYHLVLAVADLENGYYYTFTWYVPFPGDPPLQVGETRYCYFTLPYTPWAPPEFPVTFFPGTVFSDLDPSNDIGTVVLRGAGAAAPTSVPTLSTSFLIFLTAALVALGRIALVREMLS